VNSNPLDGKAFTEIAEIYTNQEQYDEAFDSINKALKITGDNLKAMYLLGIIFARKGNIMEAIGKWEEVVAIDGNSVEAEEARKNIAVAQNWAKILGKRNV